MNVLKNIFNAFILSLLLEGCTRSDDVSVHQGQLSRHNFIIEFDSNPTLGEEICTYLYFKNEDYKIKTAYIDCSIISLDSIDTKKYEIKGCSKKLYMEGDSIVVCLFPEKTGQFKFHDIKLLYTDLNKNIFIADTTFEFSVK